MAKDLTPKFKKLKPASRELDLQAGASESGQQGSGFSVFSNIFSRGEGEAVFSITRNGVSVSSPRSQKEKSGFKLIQEAIDWANSQGGGTVFIPAGTYTIESDLTLYSNITLLGDDDDSTIIDFDNNAYSLKATGSFPDGILTNIHVRNLQFKNCTDASDMAINWATVYDSSIEDCYFTNNWNSGSAAGGDINLAGNSCQRIAIRRCRSIESGDFINGGGGKLVITDNYMEDGLANGIIANSSGIATSHIINNTVNEPTDSGFYLGLNSSSNIVMNNFINSFGDYGIYVRSPGNLLQGNYIDGALSGKDLIHLATLINRTRIQNNYLSRSAETYSGVHLSTDCDGNVITGNVFSGGATSDYGVTISSSCDQTIVTNNSFFNMQTDDVSDSGTGTIEANNASL
jgi:hypothetical protein